MAKWLKYFWTPPSFPDNETKTLQAALLHATLLVSITMAAMYTLSVPFAYEKPGLYLVIGLTITLTDLGLFLLLQHGYLKQIALFFTTLNWLLFTTLAVLGGGLKFSTASAYFLIAIIAILTLSNKWGILFTALSLASILTLSILEQQGRALTPYLSSTPAMQIVAIAITLGGGAAILIIVNNNLMQNLREQRRIAQLLEKRNATLSALLDALPDAIFRLNAEGIWIDHIPSKEFKTLLPPAEFLGKSLEATLPEELASQTRFYLQQTLETGQVHSFEYELNGAYFEGRFVPSEGNHVVVIVRDITERVEAQKEYTKLLDTLERRNAQLRTAAEVSKTCSAIFDRKVLIEKAVNLIQKGLGVYYVGLFLVDEEKQQAVLQGGSGEAGKQMLEADYHLPLKGQSMIAWCIRHNRARIAQQTTRDRVWLQNPYLPQTRSELALPLTSREQVIGALTVQSTRENAFSPGDITILQAMAEQLAITIDNANLFTKLQHELAERRRVEAALRSSEEKFQKIFRSSPVAISIRDLDGRYINVNDGFTALTGYTLEEVVGKSVEELGYIVNFEAWHKSQKRLRKEGAVKDLVLEIRRKDGRQVFVLANSELTTLDGEVRVLTSSMDITERKQAEEALKASEEKFAKAFHASPNAAFIQRVADHVYLEVNDAFCRLTGFERAEVLASSAIEKSIFGKAGMPPGLIERLQNEKELRNYEMKFFTKTGQAGTGLLSVERITVNNEACFLVLIQDVTQQKRAEAEREALIQELSLKNAELERFTYTVSHDLKSPLVTIRGFAGYLEQDAALGDLERLRNDIDRINKAAGQMQRLLDELLELSRIGRLVNPPEHISMDDLVREAISLVEGQLTAAQVEVQVEPALPAVYGDRTRLLEVFQNLLDNAIKFMGPQKQPRIEIGVKTFPNGEQAFFVRDNGIGIAPQYHEKIFGLFDKLDRNSEGTGVGLALVKRIIDVHNGKIWVQSELGHGATFYFTLPGPQSAGGKDGQ